MSNYFKFDALGATFKKEIIGGITTFLALVYILSVEPQILSGSTSLVGHENMSYFGVFLGLCIASFLSTFIMGLFANIPVAIAPSMGVNVMFAFNIAGGPHADNTIIGYEGALIATTISSICFLIFSITPLRRLVIDAIPEQLMIAVGVGIAFFIAYVGLSDIGWVGHTGSGVPIAELGSLKENYPAIILGTGLFILMLFFYFFKISGGVALSLLLGLVIALIVANAGSTLKVSIDDGTNRGIFADANFVGGYAKWNYDFAGFSANIKNTWSEFTNIEIWNKPTIYISIFIMMFLNFFDATGTLTTFSRQLNQVSKVDRPLSHQALIIDSGATVIGSAFGVSPMGVYVESSAGIAQGARTGFSAIITSFFFLISIALFPIFKAMPSAVSGAATLFVGVMMLQAVIDLDWKKPEIAIATFFGILFMVVTFTIANGIGVIIILYTLVKLFKKEWQELPITLYVLSFIFVGYFVAFAFVQL